MGWKKIFWEYPWADKRPGYYSKELQQKRYRRAWFDAAIIVGLGLIALVSIVVMLVSSVAWVTRWDCNKFEQNTGITTEFKSLTCYANYKGEWVEKDNIILTIEGNK